MTSLPYLAGRHAPHIGPFWASRASRLRLKEQLPLSGRHITHHAVELIQCAAPAVGCHGYGGEILLTLRQPNFQPASFPNAQQLAALFAAPFLIAQHVRSFLRMVYPPRATFCSPQHQTTQKREGNDQALTDFDVRRRIAMRKF
jgi:hypothetical protein